jgi:hypothetical protein
MIEREIPRNKQIDLWDQQHFLRNTGGPEGTVLRDTPTPTALYLSSLLPNDSNILEIGSANGRDARSWALRGHKIDCIDFSRVALTQLEELAKEQGISHLINTHCHDVGDGSLPKSLSDDISYNAFYARSALTIDDSALNILVKNISKKMRPEGIILIEGRSLNDPKIRRSRIDGNMADDNGHLRRVYTTENMINLAQRANWNVKEISEHKEDGFESVIHMLRFVATCSQINNL